MNDVNNKENKDVRFSWEKFNSEKFFAETDKIAKVLRDVREKNDDSKHVEIIHEG